MTENSTTTVEKIVALGGGFQDYRQPSFAGEVSINMVVATLRSTVAVQYGNDQPRDAVVKAIQYWIKNDGTVQVTLLGTRIGETISPSAIVGLSWAVTR